MESPLRWPHVLVQVPHYIWSFNAFQVLRHMFGTKIVTVQEVPAIGHEKDLHALEIGQKSQEGTA